MRVLFVFLLWCILLVVCWPLAILALLLFPVVWLIALPFRLLGVATEALFATLRTVLLLPVRVLNWPFQKRRPAPG
jgi:hypothetical protein